MKQILKYLIFIMFGIILYLLYNSYDTFSIGGQVWAIPVGDENMVLGDIDLSNYIQLSVPPRLPTNYRDPDLFHTYVDVNRVYNFRNSVMPRNGYYFITDIDPSFGLTRNLQDAIELERRNQFGPQIQGNLPRYIEFRNAHLPPRRTDAERQTQDHERNQVIVDLNRVLDRQREERLEIMQRQQRLDQERQEQQRQAQVRQDLDARGLPGHLVGQTGQIRISRFTCSAINERA